MPSSFRNRCRFGLVMCCGSISRLCAASLLARPCLRPLAKQCVQRPAPEELCLDGPTFRRNWRLARRRRRRSLAKPVTALCDWDHVLLAILLFAWGGAIKNGAEPVV
jgi:hypothetical protein